MISSPTRINILSQIMLPGRAGWRFNRSSVFCPRQPCGTVDVAWSVHGNISVGTPKIPHDGRACFNARFRIMRFWELAQANRIRPRLHSGPGPIQRARAGLSNQQTNGNPKPYKPQKGGAGKAKTPKRKPKIPKRPYMSTRLRKSPILRRNCEKPNEGVGG